MHTTTSRKGIGGPRTPEGKRRVSINALKHGLCAESPQGLQEVARMIGRQFEDILGEMLAHYHPADPIEELLVRRIARCAWRLAITESMEERVLMRCPFRNTPAPSQDRIIRHERRIDIQLHRAIAALERLRWQKNAQNKLPQGPTPRSNHEGPQPEFVPPKTPNCRCAMTPIRPRAKRHGKLKRSG